MKTFLEHYRYKQGFSQHVGLLTEIHFWADYIGVHVPSRCFKSLQMGVAGVDLSRVDPTPIVNRFPTGQNLGERLDKLSGMGIIIFDMDGTLIDSMDLYTNAFCSVLDQFCGIDPDVSKEVFRSTAGLPLNEQFKIVCDSQKAASSQNVHVMIERFWKLAGGTNAEPAPNADIVIRELASAGYTLIVSSGSTSSVVNSRMRQAKIAKYFRLLLGTDYDSTEMIKGEKHFKIIQRELSITPSDFKKTSVMVGDGPYDVIMAKEAGIFSIAKTSLENSKHMKKLGADVTIRDLSQLVDVVSRPLNEQHVFMPLSQVISSRKPR